MARYRIMARNAIPAPPMPKAPTYVRPPLSWLIADAELLPSKAWEMFDRGEIVLHHKTWSLHFHPDKVEQEARAKTLQTFVEHFACSTVGGLNRDETMARYATELFGPLYDRRFKPGFIAQKSGGMPWKAWMNEECALINEYRKYLLDFGRYKTELERAHRELEESRRRWIEENLEPRFKNSKAYKRYVARDTN
ncbi:hypothetical protein KFL_008050050 [Klebsormidium nitens]|uniref:Uncharacterized protein n=1 Tax=Klebsormidium nitens TaxID=105231 RepID=A0A1Y1ILK6_KLENI|nr:hypothetical protein KFL_008050050 [Klebsormidium nitens]|eukprot:GAQ91553.1 hypothetical protein KFL_008050050 [Klebsormidium nitens]